MINKKALIPRITEIGKMLDIKHINYYIIKVIIFNGKPVL